MLLRKGYSSQFAFEFHQIAMATGVAAFLIAAWWVGLPRGAASAAVRTATRYVDAAACDDGRDCTNPAAPCATIRRALEQAHAGDSICVAQGVYHESLVITTTVHLQGGYEAGSWSRSLAPYTTVICGADPMAPVIQVQSGESSTTILDGLTIREGGGGVYAQASRLAIQGCRIVHNFAGDSAGGIEVDRCLVAITNTLIADNYANQDMAIRILSTQGAPGPESVVTIHSCTIANNHASDPRSVIFCSLSWCHLRNSIVWGNNSQRFEGQGVYVTYSDIQGGQEGEGNISLDPAFADPASGDYHLLPDSPCCDAGASDGAPGTDWESDPRPVGTGWDMGCDEFRRVTWLPIVIRRAFLVAVVTTTGTPWPTETCMSTATPTSTPTGPASPTPTPTTTPTSQPGVAYRLYGLDFSPYVDGQDPNFGSQVPEAQLRERMQVVAPYTQWIRTFGCGSGLESAGRIAHEMGLKIAAGAWLGSEPEAEEANASQIECLIALANAGEADIAIVGCEALQRGFLEEEELVGYIRQVRAAIPLTIPVTTGDTYGKLLSHRAVISAVDVVFMNAYPYWEGIELDRAVAAFDRAYQQVVAAADGKPVIVSETGWPSCGPAFGNAVPNLENACFYFLNFVSWARANDVPYFYFEAFDETWKADHEGPQGACWGIWDKDGVMKSCMQDVFNGLTIPDNWSATRYSLRR